MTFKPHHTSQSPDFIGRKKELREVTNRLLSEQCRLLTLVGVGGIGKTRLALRIIDELRNAFDDGVHYVDLQAAQSTEVLISTIASVLGMALSRQEPPAEQLLRFLQRKKLLLLLDNFEQLIGSSDLLSQILQHSPDVRLLITSREALNLKEEYRYIVRGLETPESYHVHKLATCDSVQLFVERAQRIRNAFSLDEERAGVVRICQLVEGMPLAIEMAASWTKTLRCATIAAEIQQNLNFLKSNLRNVQDRHQSMEVVFVQTWSRLTKEEQKLFSNLSIFRGGFTRESAEAVAGASLSLLSSLLDKCLIQRDPNERYRIHELLRQYAEDGLSDKEMVEAAENHCRYFADFMEARKRGIVEKFQLVTSMEIERELENIRAAWLYAIDQHNVEALEHMAAPYFYYCQIRSHFLESAKASEQAVAMLEEMNQQELIAQIQVYWGWMLIRIGQFERAADVLQQSQETFERLNMAPAYGMGSHPLSAFAVLKGSIGSYETAIEMSKQLKRESEANEDIHNLAFACYALTSAYSSLGQYEKAQDNARQAVEYAERVGNSWFKAYCLIEWGRVVYATGNYDKAKLHFQASLRIREDFDDPEGIAVVSAQLGEVALAQQEYGTATHLFDRSLGIYQNLNDKGGLATVHQGLGKVAVGTNQTREAAIHLREALTIADQIQFLPLVLSIMLDIAELLLKDNRHQLAKDVLQVVADHPANDAQHQRQVESLWMALASQEDSPAPDLHTLLRILYAELERFAAHQSDTQPLVDPLTPRELEVLQMIAAGMTNLRIAEKLVIARGTVKAHTSNIYSKLGVSNRTEAVAKSIEIGILS